MRAVGSDGEEFLVPPTPLILDALFSFRRWGPAEAATAAYCLTLAALAVTRALPLWAHIALFAAARLAYNGGIGCLLRAQGADRWLSRAVKVASPRARVLLRWASTAALQGGIGAWGVHPDLDAWLVFRTVAFVVLVADGASYMALAYAAATRCGMWAAALRLAVGAPLVIAAYAAKHAARDKLGGDYGWSWGDFFFVAQHTAFVADGIFALVPHPMYTAGYAAYYGLSVAAGSHALLAVSLLAHAAQIAFIYLVEEPHIRRTYGAAEESRKASASSAEITPLPPPYNPQAALVARLSDVRCVPAAVCALVLALCTAGSLSFWALLAAAAAWRATHWGALFLVCVEQRRCGAWCQAVARDDGVELRAAFQRWKAVYATSYGVQHALFLAAALRAAPPPDAAWSLLLSPAPEARAVSRIVASAVLLAASLAVATDAYTSLGQAAFCYGDFFVRPAKRPRYTGAYRYAGHPAALAEGGAYLAVALYRRSWALAAFAAAALLLHVAFVRYVEMPHMLQLYQGVRSRAPLVEVLGNAVRDHVPAVARVVRRLRGAGAGAEARLIDCVQTTAEQMCAHIASGTAEKGADDDGDKATVAVIGALDGVVGSLERIDGGVLLRGLRRLGVKVDGVGETNRDSSSRKHD